MNFILSVAGVLLLTGIVLLGRREYLMVQQRRIARESLFSAVSKQAEIYRSDAVAAWNRAAEQASIDLKRYGVLCKPMSIRDAGPYISNSRRQRTLQVLSDMPVNECQITPALLKKQAC